MRLSLIVSAATLALVCGCGSSSPDPNDPANQQNQYGAYTPPVNTVATTPTGTYTTPPPGGTAPTNPGTGAASGSPATPIAVPAAQAVQPLLTQLAAGEVQGMQPDGSSFAGQFQEGQVLEQAFTIQAGKCYSVVGASMGIQELDIQLIFHPAPLPPQVLAQDNSQGGTAVLGGKSSGCFKNALPVGGPGKIVVKATRGSGLAIAQIYIK